MALLLACGDSPERRRSEGAERVVSLAPSITRIVVALGAEPALVGVDEYSLRQVAEVASVASVGGLYAPDLERIVELEPTLVLAVASAQQRSVLGTLSARGIRVLAIDPYTLEEHLESVVAIGRLIGHGARAEETVAEIRRGLDHVAGRAPPPGAPRTAVAMVLEREPLYVVGRGSFVHELIEIAGGRNAFADVDAPFPQVSLEVLAERAPGLLIDTTAPGDDEVRARTSRAFWARFLPETRVVVVPQGDLSLPGVHVAASAATLQRLLEGGER